MSASAWNWITLQSKTLAKVYITLQSVLLEIMKDQGGNTYKPPHMGKDKLIREGKLPNILEVDSTLYEETLKLIADYEKQQVEKEEEKMKDKQANKASKSKGRSQVIVDDDPFIPAKEYATWLEDASSIVRPFRRVKSVCQCLIAFTYLICFKIASYWQNFVFTIYRNLISFGKHK